MKALLIALLLTTIIFNVHAYQSDYICKDVNGVYLDVIVKVLQLNKMTNKLEVEYRGTKIATAFERQLDEGLQLWTKHSEKSKRAVKLVISSEELKGLLSYQPDGTQIIFKCY